MLNFPPSSSPSSEPVNGPGSARFDRPSTPADRLMALAANQNGGLVLPAPNSCFQLTGSLSCPSFTTAFVKSSSSALNGTGISSLTAFDVLVNKTVYGFGKTLFQGLGCGSEWNPTFLRYSYHYVCEYYLNQPEYIGGPPGSSSDCNVINGNRATLVPLIDVTVCNQFLQTLTSLLKNAKLCPPSTAAVTSLRDNLLSAVTTNCQSTAFAAPLNSSTASSRNVIDITKDGAESGLCGFGSFPWYNDTTALNAAYTMCFNLNGPPYPNNSCCTVDPNVAAALSTSVVYPIPNKQISANPLASTCNVVFNRFFVVSCSNLIGGIIGTLLGIVSLFVVARYASTTSNNDDGGSGGKESSTLSRWWRDSPFSSTSQTAQRRRAAAAAAADSSSSTGKITSANVPRSDLVPQPPPSAVLGLTVGMGRAGYLQHQDEVIGSERYQGYAQYPPPQQQLHHHHLQLQQQQQNQYQHQQQHGYGTYRPNQQHHHYLPSRQQEETFGYGYSGR